MDKPTTPSSHLRHLGYQIVVCDGGWTVHRSPFTDGPHVVGIFATPHKAKRAIERALKAAGGEG